MVYFLCFVRNEIALKKFTFVLIFMRNVSGIRVLAGILVVCFLFTSIISRSFDSFGLFKNAKSSWIAKQSETPLKSDSQLIDEEIGEEKSEKNFGDGADYSAPATGFLICLFASTITFTVPDRQSCYYYLTPFAGGRCDIPLYLVHRSLQI